MAAHGRYQSKLPSGHYANINILRCFDESSAISRGSLVGGRAYKKGQGSGNNRVVVVLIYEERNYQEQAESKELIVF